MEPHSDLILLHQLQAQFHLQFHLQKRCHHQGQLNLKFNPLIRLSTSAEPTVESMWRPEQLNHWLELQHHQARFAHSSLIARMKRTTPYVPKMAPLRFVSLNAIHCMR